MLGRLFNLFLGDSDYSKWSVQEGVLSSGRGTRKMLYYDKNLKRQVSLIGRGEELLKETEDIIIQIIDMGYCKQDGGNCGIEKTFSQFINRNREISRLEVDHTELTITVTFCNSVKEYKTIEKAWRDIA